MDRIYLCLAHMSGKEQQYIQEAFDTNWVVPLGPNVNAFEEDLAAFANRRDGAEPLQKQVVALSAGTAAIHLGLIMLGVEKGDEVICQSFTFAASANPVVYQGATPVFVDSEPGTYNMDPQLLEEAIKDRIAKTGKKPKAIIPVYLYGMPARIDEIFEVAKRYEIPVLEDAAEGFGSVYKGQVCGTFGDYGVMSFNGNKMITTSGGGALICPDSDTKKRVMFYATQAREPFPYYQHEKIGYNYRMSNICAGIGRGQMTVADEHIRHHQWVHEQYEKAFAEIDAITVHSAPEEYMKPNYWLSTIRFEDGKHTVDGELLSLIQKLSDANIETRPLWKPMHLQPVYKDAPAYTNGVSERLFSCGLCLPSGPYVREEEINYIVRIIVENL
ncbi:MAG: aminotransferase class I/II-fold pyridoxal phosphate-dependent enzyme [Bacteroidaceae bacterium]|nr:aminotransferase class I/II-fold pyridoxal phosphate-dependent enzyme [Bacteroidaceae bacterium]MBS7322771.1 aminotransferase class I/II-fold pyridoxal phosphate-dependent enzyme [Bacteroidaceae bacterium]